ncbi:hypothetical protein K443DRAFT_675977 [Laccaria amethystina LaAM-08-1]|uniref:Unplaced genomic scaffold K443scaffold_35, whole genome shotgun sequence n=1 Tax=Laccaria amethystina LaAM-08-1 TaxID=1095629 RepID=A0A0C9Y8J1_9AGAR|nr:hypothetical protein K443DRAFT_675977 [Laccaria amethystina LaAM-08-1]
MAGRYARLPKNPDWDKKEADWKIRGVHLRAAGSTSIVAVASDIQPRNLAPHRALLLSPCVQPSEKCVQHKLSPSASV